jgi:hypothetical protein
MTRLSRDHFNTSGRLIEGFDYDNQAWVQLGVYLDCGHVPDSLCGCYGRKHKGEETPTPAKGGTKLYVMQVTRIETSEGWIDVRATSDKEAVEIARVKARQGLVIFPPVKPMLEYQPRVFEEVEE